MKPQNLDSRPLRKLRGIRLDVGGLLLAATALAVSLTGGCAAEDSANGPTDTRAYALQSFDSCGALDSYLTDMATEMFVQSYVYGGYMDYGLPTRGGAVETDTGAPQSGGTDTGTTPAAPSDYTTTNVQEAGVDELDQMKTDGQTVYYALGNVLHIIDSWPAEQAHELATVELDGYGESLFLDGNVLVAFTQISEGTYPYYCDLGACPLPAQGGGVDQGGGAPATGAAEPAPTDATPSTGTTTPVDVPPGGDVPPTDVPYTPPFNATRATLIDVSDPANPVVLRTIDVEGSLVSARMVDGIVYVASMMQAYYYEPELAAALDALDLPDPWTMTADERAAAADAVRAQVRPVFADYMTNGGRATLIPDLRTNDGERADLLSCSQVMRPGHKSDLSMLSVYAFDPNGDGTVHGVGLLANGWQVYGSQNALYVAQDSRWWWWPSPESRFAETDVHEFDLNAGEPAYVASGKVPGWILNQFSMSEYQGTLRIATTDQSTTGWWWGGPVEAAGGGVATTDGGTTSTGGTADAGSGTSSSGTVDAGTVEPAPDASPEPQPQPTTQDANNVFVLQRDGNELGIIGEARGIAPGEQIYAARFIGDRGYMVTFRQVDPLFVIDLSDPTSPTVQGQLHLTGFSSYLHPFGDHYLIGVGREATDTGQVQDFQLQLFDVSDPANPVRLYQTVLQTPSSGGWSYSEAEHDPHAFTFYASHDLLAIPVTLEDYSYEQPDYEYFSGIIVYHVSAEDGFVEVGRISHTGFASQLYCSDAARVDPTTDASCSSYAYPWYANMRRSAFIDEYLFAFSNLGVTASPLTDIPNPVATIPLF